MEFWTAHCQELDDLHQSAVNLLYSDADQAKLLFLGCIHECDSLVRARLNGNEESQTTAILNKSEIDESSLSESQNKSLQMKSKLEINEPRDNSLAFANAPAAFHFIYANSLFYLGLLDPAKTFANQFYDASISRIREALCIEREFSILASLARSLIHRAAFAGDIFLVEYQEIIDELMKSSSDCSMVELAYYNAQFSDKMNLFEDRKHWISKTIEIWSHVKSKDENCVEAWVGCGNAHVSLSDDLLDLITEDVVDDTLANEAKEHLLKAIGNFEQAILLCQDSQEILKLKCQLGEIMVNMGNIADDADEENEESLAFYASAVSYFNEILSTDAGLLPKEFHLFLSEWQSEME